MDRFTFGLGRAEVLRRFADDIHVELELVRDDPGDESGFCTHWCARPRVAGTWDRALVILGAQSLAGDTVDFSACMFVFVGEVRFNVGATSGYFWISFDPQGGRWSIKWVIDELDEFAHVSAPRPA